MERPKFLEAVEEYIRQVSEEYKIYGIHRQLEYAFKDLNIESADTIRDLSKEDRKTLLKAHMEDYATFLGNNYLDIRFAISSLEDRIEGVIHNDPVALQDDAEDKARSERCMQHINDEKRLDEIYAKIEAVIGKDLFATLSKEFEEIDKICGRSIKEARDAIATFIRSSVEEAFTKVIDNKIKVDIHMIKSTD